MKKLLLFVIIFIFMSCSTDVSTGGTDTELGETTVVGTVYKDGSIKSGASVTAVPLDFKPGKDIDTLVRDTTDINGRFSITLSQNTDYNIIIRSANGANAILRSISTEEKDTNNLNQLSIKPTGSIALPSDSFDINIGDTISITGTDIFSVVTSLLDTIILQSLPEGTLSEITKFNNESALSIESDITILSGLTTSLPLGFSLLFLYDTGYIANTSDDDTKKLILELGCNFKYVSIDSFNVSMLQNIDVIFLSRMIDSLYSHTETFRNSSLPLIATNNKIYDDLNLTDNDTDSSGREDDFSPIVSYLHDILNFDYPLDTAITLVTNAPSSTVKLNWGQPDNSAYKVLKGNLNQNHFFLFTFNEGNTVADAGKRVALFSIFTETGTTNHGFTEDAIKIYKNAIKWALK